MRKITRTLRGWELRGVLLTCILILTSSSLYADGRNDYDVIIEGSITSISEGNISVDGVSFFVTDSTQIDDNNGNPVLFSDLQIDDGVKMRGIIVNGGFTATRIKLEDSPNHEGELETQGAIQALGDNYVIVNSITIFADETTEIKNHGDTISFGDLNEGDNVKVKADLQPDAAFLANLIKILDGNGEGEFETEGVIESLGDSSLTVNGFLFIVDENTIIKDHDNIIPFESLSAGDFVEIKANMLGDNSFLATRIKLEDDHENEIEIEGTIESKDVSSLVVNGMTFFVNDQTEILDHDQNPITFADLMVGMRVEIKALVQPDGSLLATRIKIEDENEGEIEITAPIEDIFDNTIVVSGIEFLTDENTIILDDNRNPITFGDLQIGMIVEVRGILLGDGSHYATRIKLEDFFSETIEFEGTLTAISETSGQVGDRVFAIDGATLIFDENGNPVDVTFLTVGMFVEVRSLQQTDGSLLATRIKVDNNSNSVILAVINGVTPNQLQLGNITVNLNNNTFITDLANNQTTQTELKAGLTVKVKIKQQANGNYEADRLKISNDPDIIKVSGTVASVANNEIVILQQSYEVNASTVTLNINYQPVDFSTIQPGDDVTIWSDISTNGSPAALQIKKTSNSVTSTGDGIKTTVDDFELSQNYPNPFNPATNIRFTIPESDFVTIKIYNAIGEEVQTLVNTNFAAGTHTLQFNGSNLASGLYFYRIQAGSFVQVKKMMLLK